MVIANTNIFEAQSYKLNRQMSGFAWIVRFIILACCLVSDSADMLTQTKTYMEEIVGKFADRILSEYKKRCNEEVTNCTTKSYNMCVGTGTRRCFENFPTPSNCLSNGIYLSSESTVKIPDTIEPKDLSHDQRLFICSSAKIHDFFEQLGEQNDKQYTYAYVGSSNGIFRLYPGFKGITDQTTGQCFRYDPRRRPWYVSAITGPKNTIILLDSSKTMTNFFNGVRMRNALTTMEAIFETFNQFDRFGVISFADTATILGNMQHIDTYTESRKNSIIQDSNNLKASAGTNYKEAFLKAFEMLGTEADLYTQCSEIIILIMTDGSVQSQVTFQELQALIEQKMATNLPKHALRIISFVFGRTENINYEVIQKITCRYQGIVFLMEDNMDQSQMVEKLTNYYIFLSVGYTNKKPIWSQPYVDSSGGFGSIISISKPIYLNDSNGIQKVLGVVSMDLQMSELLKYGRTEAEVIQIMQDEKVCFTNSLTQEQLEILRCQEQSSCKNTTNCLNYPASENQCGHTISNDVFYSKGETKINTSFDPDNCCGLTIKEFIIVMCSVLGFFIVLLIVLICLYRKGKLRRLNHCFRGCEGCCPCPLKQSSSKDEDGEQDIQKRKYSMNTNKSLQFLSTDGMKMLEGTKIEDPDGIYLKAMMNGKILYDDNDDSDF